MARPATATTAARLATVFQASGCDFSSSILTARGGLPGAAGLSLMVTKRASGSGRRLHAGPGGQPPRVDGGGERGVVPFVLVRGGRGEVRHGTVECLPLAEVGGDGDPVPPPGVRAGQGRAADARVEGGPRHEEGLDVRAALPVMELAYVVVAGYAVESLDPLPAQEDVRRRLHQPLSRDHALAVVRVGAGAAEPLEHRRLCLLDLQEQRVIMVT